MSTSVKCDLDSEGYETLVLDKSSRITFNVTSNDSVLKNEGRANDHLVVVIVDSFQYFYPHGPMHIISPGQGLEVWCNRWRRLHRLDGPAHIYSNSRSWYIDGVQVDFDEFCSMTNKSDSEKLFLKLRWG